MKPKNREILVKNHIHEPTFLVFEDQAVCSVIEALRKTQCDGKILYFYVIDLERHLKGVVSARALLIAEPHAIVKEIMEQAVFCLHEDQNLEEAMEALSNKRLLALPVVDQDHKLIGVVDVQMYLEENIDIFKSERSEDVFQLIGMRLEEGFYRSPFKGYSKRMPWILCNMFGGIACAVVSSVYQEVLGQVLILAMFIPLVLSLSESISMQSMTQSFLVLRKEHASFRKILRRMVSEIKIAALMALTSGVIVGSLSLLWNSGFKASCVIGTGIFVSIIGSSVLGSSIPLILHRRRLDPKVASGPVVLTIADVITTTVYLAIATGFLI